MQSISTVLHDNIKNNKATMVIQKIDLSLDIISKIGSGVSLVVLSLFIYIIVKQLINKDNTNQAVLWIFVFESIYCIGILFPTFGTEDNNKAICKLQSSIIVFGNMTLNIWITMIGYLSWKSFENRSSYDSKKKKIKQTVFSLTCLLCLALSIL